uniref:Uncharacterized protein n=1 Tax=Tetranychus urticae TaxID=32264 RepID=T1KER5_TETUR
MSVKLNKNYHLVDHQQQPRQQLQLVLPLLRD